MWYWYVMLFFSLQVPIIMFFIGFVWRKNPPKTINHFYGYRTKRSKSSQEAWDFAHKYFGDWRYKLGVITLILTVLIYIFMAKITYNSIPNTSILALGLILFQTIILILPMIPTEKKLKNKDYTIYED